MKKKISVIMIIAALAFVSCGKTDTQRPISSTKPVDIYVSDDVDVLGNKINGNDTVEISKEPSSKIEQETQPSIPSVAPNKEATYEGLEVYFIDVGQADCILIRIDGEDDILIDGGNNGDGEDLADYLKYIGVNELSAVIATHPHEDHIGATDVVMSEITTDMVYMPYINEEDIPTTKTYKDFLLSIEDNDIVAVEAKNNMMVYDSATCQIQIISPDEVEPGDLNDYSIVTKLTYGNNSFIFTGDASSTINQYIMDNYSGDFLDVDVLKSGHHGSRTSNTKEWIKALSPEYAVIMCESGNSYGHPHKEAINALEGVTLYRTDTDGTIKMTSDGSVITIETKLTGDVPLGNKEFSINNIK